MARKALYQKGNMTEFVTVHSLCNPGTWIILLCTLGMIIPYWVLSPSHKIKLI